MEGIRLDSTTPQQQPEHAVTVNDSFAGSSLQHSAPLHATCQGKCAMHDEGRAGFVEVLQLHVLNPSEVTSLLLAAISSSSSLRVGQSKHCSGRLSFKAGVLAPRDGSPYPYAARSS